MGDGPGEYRVLGVIEILAAVREALGLEYKI
jgi:hypothetical protein